MSKTFTADDFPEIDDPRLQQIAAGAANDLAETFGADNDDLVQQLIDEAYENPDQFEHTPIMDVRSFARSALELKETSS